MRLDILEDEVLFERSVSLEGENGSDLDDRIRMTLDLLRDWGQAAPAEQLSEILIGGRIDENLLRSRLATMQSVVVSDGIACLEGSEELIPKTLNRLRAHRVLEYTYMEVAKEFAVDLQRWCPLVRCIAIAGSLATGGFDEGDDIDFDLFVETGSKYTVYLIATLIGLKYALRYRHRQVDAFHRTPFLPKLTCVNVVWTEEEIRPFVRQDLAMAFELMRCLPLYGDAHFRSVLTDNPWLRTYFPQIHQRDGTEEVEAPVGPAGRVFSLLKRLRLLGLVERGSRSLARVLYRYVQWTRRRDPEALARMAFLQRVKWPYEVFQD